MNSETKISKVLEKIEIELRLMNNYYMSNDEYICFLKDIKAILETGIVKPFWER